MDKYGQHHNIFPLFIALHTIHLDNSWSKLLLPWLSWLWWPIRHDEPRAALVTPKHCDSPHANRPAFQNTTPILRAGFCLMTITSKNKTCKICKIHYIKCCRWPIWVFCFSLPQGETPLWDFETAPTHHSQACSCGSSSTLPLALAGTVCSPACRRTSVLKTNPHQPHLKGCNPAEKQRTTMLQWWLRSWCGRRPAPPRHLVPQEHKSYVALWWELETPGSWCSAKTATLHQGSESEFGIHDFKTKS